MPITDELAILHLTRDTVERWQRRWLACVQPAAPDPRSLASLAQGIRHLVTAQARHHASGAADEIDAFLSVVTRKALYEASQEDSSA
ncbi:MAG TPA: hypothetical protein PLJ35_09145 [Anaerolineae bacterium]|nr:hypothetical protein [Anaerolineae bacterium]HPL28898.1 hypothetical protein [Anaerolineae bacterium]